MRINVDISVNDYDRQLFDERRIVLETRAGESMVHIVLKVLAMAMYHDEGLMVEPSMDDEERYRPDLLIRHDDYRPKLWVECGQCRVSKLDKVTFKHYDAQVKMLKRTAREAGEILERCKGEVRRIENLECIGFDGGFVDHVAAALTGKNDLVAIISGRDLQFVVEGETFETKIHRFRVEPRS